MENNTQYKIVGNLELVHHISTGWFSKDVTRFKTTHLQDYRHAAEQYSLQLTMNFMDNQAQYFDPT